MRVLFISRAFPPVIGGIENQNKAVADWLDNRLDCTIIVNRYGRKFLPLFIPWAIVRGALLARKADVILLGDGVATVIGYFIRNVYPDKPVYTILHGLDVTYGSAMYQRLWVRRFFSCSQGFIAVSQSTADIAAMHGVDKSLIRVIPNGIDINDVPALPANRLSTIVGQPMQGKYVLLTLGRLVKRKGVAWFVNEVMPELPGNVFCIIAGDGPEKDDIDAAIRARGLQDRCLLLGRVNAETREALYAGCDLFIQPNIPVAGDAEGFGIVVLEAGMRGLPVVASDMEGLRDAVCHNENGWLVEPCNVEGFVNRIRDCMYETDRHAAGNRAREYVIRNFHWEKLIDDYINFLESGSSS